MNAKKILLYILLIKRYLEHGLRLTAFHQFVEHEQGKPFSQFSEEVGNAKREADKDLFKKQLADVAKLKVKVLWENDRGFGSPQRHKTNE